MILGGNDDATSRLKTALENQEDGKASIPRLRDKVFHSKMGKDGRFGKKNRRSAYTLEGRMYVSK